MRRMADDDSGFSRRGSHIATRPASTGDGPASAGEILDARYRIDALLGEGGVGRVYRAHDLELDEAVAVKLLHDVTPTTAELLRREVRLARRVTHENVVRVHDLGVTANGEVYLTMELVDGRSLREILRDAPPARGEAAALALQICEGLDAAHRAGVVHADLKPANVLVRAHEGRRQALISDFGISRALVETHRGWLVAGTPQYMPPEQRTAGPLDATADVYALGVVLYELFTGERLVKRDGVTDERVLTERARTGLPSPLASVIARALSSDPTSRPPSARAVAAAVSALGEDADDAATVVGSPSRATRRLLIAPLRVLGADGEEHLGVGVAEELARLLDPIPELSVVGAGAAASSEDARETARRLGADLVLEGTLQRAGERVRVTPSLVERESGVRVWSERFDGSLQDAFAFQEEIAARICEALRLRFIEVAEAQRAAPEAVDLYFRARTQLVRGAAAGPGGAVDLVERSLALVPDLAPALALRAMACAKTWFLPSYAMTRDWAAVSRAAAALALERAPALAESHVAAALVAAQDADVETCARSLRRALDLAPTSAPAHDYLGRFLMEVGRTREGLEHLELAQRIDPTTDGPMFYIARHHALRGDRSLVDALHGREGHAFIPASQLLVRVAAWFGDRDDARRTLERSRQLPVLRQEAELVESFCLYLLGELSPDEVDRRHAAGVPAELLSKRVRSNIHQAMTEGHAARGAIDRALRHLVAAAELALVDLEWLARCPCLDPLRGTEDWARAERLTRERAQAFLTA